MLSNRVLAIDIGHSKIKMVIGKQKKNNVRVEEVVTFGTPIASYSNGFILKPNEIAKCIKHHLDDKSIKVSGAIFTLSSTDIITRQLVLPKIKKKELSTMVEFEIQQYLPINMEDYIIEYKLLADVDVEGVKKHKVQVAVLPREIAKTYYDLVTELGIKPIALDTSDNAISKLINNTTIINKELTVKDKTIALLDIGYSGIDLSIIANGVASFSRIITQGSRDIVMNVANVCSMTIMDAEDMIFKSGKVENISDRYAQEIIMDKLDDWLEDISRVFQYYTSRESGNRIDEIYLYGGVSDYEVFKNMLTKSLNIPVERITDINNINCSKEFDCDVSSYLNAIGSIIRR